MRKRYSPQFKVDAVIEALKEDLTIAQIGSDKQVHLNKDQLDVCKDCEYRYACHDCRPLALGTQNNLHGKTARCAYDPYQGQRPTQGDYSTPYQIASAEIPKITCVTRNVSILQTNRYDDQDAEPCWPDDTVPRHPLPTNQIS